MLELLYISNFLVNGTDMNELHDTLSSCLVEFQHHLLMINVGTDDHAIDHG